MWNWLKNITQRNLENPNVPLGQAIDILAGSPSSSGVRVNRDSVLGSPAVWRGVNLISSSIGKLPLTIYRRADGDSRERATSHPAYRLLYRQPSETLTPYIWKQTLIQHALIYGNGFSYIFRDELAKPTELVILDPEATYPVREGGRLLYVTTIDNKDFKLAYQDVIHIKGLSYDGLAGYSILDVMKEALGLGISLQRYGSTYFRNNGKPSVVIELPPHVQNPEKIEQFRRTWGSIHQGLENSHRPALLMAGAKLTPISGNNEDGQWIQSREHDLIMVADILGVPPSYLGASINTSYGSLEMDQSNFLATGLDGWLVNMEQECEAKLLSERQKLLDTHFIEFNRKALIQTDSKTEIELLATQLNNNILAWEEVRGILNLTTDDSGLTFFRQGTTVPVEEPEPPQEPPQPEDDSQSENIDEQPQEEPQEPTDDENAGENSRKLHVLTRSILERLITRVAKSVEKKSRKEDWKDYLEAEGLADDHRSVFLESLSPAFKNAEILTDSFFKDLNEELKAVARADIPRVMSRHLEDVDIYLKQLEA